jgi:hypothetical protein
MPGCHRPAQVGDIDHQPWAHSGDTNASNLDCFCRYHHRLKDQPGWRYTIDPTTREFTVTTPTSRRYRSIIERDDRPQQTHVEKTDHDVRTVPTPRSWFITCAKTTVPPPTGVHRLLNEFSLWTGRVSSWRDRELRFGSDQGIRAKLLFRFAVLAAHEKASKPHDPTEA